MKHFINIKEEGTKEFQQVGNSMSTSWKINDNGELVIKWKHKTKTFAEFKDCSVIVNCYGTFPKVYQYVPPKNIVKVLNYLFSTDVYYVPNTLCYNITMHNINNEYINSIIGYETNGLYDRVKYQDANNNLIYTELYQAEGVHTNLVLLNPDAKLSVLKDYAKLLYSDIADNLPEDCTIYEYVKRYKKQLSYNLLDWLEFVETHKKLQK